jgi:hypothetical protein
VQLGSRILQQFKGLTRKALVLTEPWIALESFTCQSLFSSVHMANGIYTRWYTLRHDSSGRCTHALPLQLGCPKATNKVQLLQRLAKSGDYALAYRQVCPCVDPLVP